MKIINKPTKLNEIEESTNQITESEIHQSNHLLIPTKINYLIDWLFGFSAIMLSFLSFCPQLLIITLCFLGGYLENTKEKPQNGTIYSKKRLNMMEFIYPKKRANLMNYNVKALAYRWKGTP